MTDTTNTQATPANDFVTAEQLAALQAELNAMKAAANKKPGVVVQTFNMASKIGGFCAYIAGCAAVGVYIGKKINERNNDTAE